MHIELILALPGSTSGSSDCLRVSVSFSDTTRALTSRSKTTHFTMFVNGLAQPVDLGITTDGIVVDVDHNNFEILVGSILSYPVGVQNSQTSKSASNTFLKKSKNSIISYQEFLNKAHSLDFLLSDI